MLELMATLHGLPREIERKRRELLAQPDQAAQLEETDAGPLAHAAFRWRRLFYKHGFHDLEEQALHLEQRWRRLTYARAAERLDLLATLFRDALMHRSVYVLKEDGLSYITKGGFGVEAERAFPSAQPEIDAARLCYALGQPTACVFHLMRAIEYLLRAFAVGVGVKRKGPIPLEYQQWQSLIEQAESKVRSSLQQRWVNKAAKEKAKHVLRASIADFYHFKDSVRNHLMHTRSGLLDEATALSIMNRVRDCFERLSPYLEEEPRTSILLIKKSLWS